MNFANARQLSSWAGVTFCGFATTRHHAQGLTPRYSVLITGLDPDPGFSNINSHSQTSYKYRYRAHFLGKFSLVQPRVYMQYIRTGMEKVLLSV
jgi:hypothetical protein